MDISTRVQNHNWIKEIYIMHRINKLTGLKRILPRPSFKAQTPSEFYTIHYYYTYGPTGRF